MPVLILQWAIGWRELWNRRRALLTAVAVVTIYLSAADAVAISQGVWTLHSARITGLKLGVLPVEEVLFFLLTNSMVVQSVILVRGFRNKESRLTSEATTG
jgi:lycopene cyclase domain-containing protein